MINWFPFKRAVETLVENYGTCGVPHYLSYSELDKISLENFRWLAISVFSFTTGLHRRPRICLCCTRLLLSGRLGLRPLLVGLWSLQRVTGDGRNAAHDRGDRAEKDAVDSARNRQSFQIHMI